MRKEDATPQELVEDSDSSVAAWGGEGLVVGYVDEVNGPGALAVPEFTASRHELLVLLKHWFEIELRIRFFWFCCECVGSSDTRLKAFAKRRVGRIAEALADEACVNKAIDEVYRVFGERRGGLAWKVYSGEATPQEEREFREEQRKCLSGNTNPEENQA